jgi:hypothetical protein
MTSGQLGPRVNPTTCSEHFGIGHSDMLTETLQELDIAFRQLEFAVRLLSYSELGHVKPSDFDTDHLTRLPNGSLHFPSGNFSEQGSICRAASINFMMAFGTSVLVLDQAFQAFGIEPDPEATDNIGRLRTLVYMVRCAHAHRIADPRWEVRGKYRRTLLVALDRTTISLDLEVLDGSGFDIDSIGGYVGWYEMHRLAKERFAEHFK